MDAFRRAVRLSYTMWGGRYNPILTVDASKLAQTLVRLFRVDALVPLSKSAEIEAFIEAHKHLQWPLIGNDLFVKAARDGKEPVVVDIGHPAMRFYEERIKNNPAPQPGLDLYEWDAADTLGDVFLCSYGAFPRTEESGVDYRELVQASLLGAAKTIPKGAEVPVRQVERQTISTLNRAGMKRHYIVQNHWDYSGFYVGEADNFDDLINFWNLRAADISLVFFDPRYADRVKAYAAQWETILRQEPPQSRELAPVALWHRRERPLDDTLPHFGDRKLTLCNVDEPIWNGRNVCAPIMYFSDASALASIDESGSTTKMSFALTDKPFMSEWSDCQQHYMLSVDPGIGLFRNEHATLHAPFAPELNEFYGRKTHGSWNAVRSEPESLGVVTSVSDDNVTLNGLNAAELIAEIFRVVGIEAAPSKPGLIASTLIRQMGGLDGCRPFKIAGVRALIEDHKPHQSFSRSTAEQVIRGQGNVRSLSDYQWLYIEPRKPGTELKNTAVFSYLLDKGVFRAGLKFDCPSCQLEFWRLLDDARSRLECEYCGHGFNAAPQLRDKAWAFRRSGLFGNDDHQEGAIPVLLTLQQLAHMRTMHHGVFTTAMALKSNGAQISKCETDFVLVVERPRDHRIQIVIGEAKARQPITASDVIKLTAVADAFPADRYDVFVVFARLSSFSAEEVELIKKVNSQHTRRAIMLTDRELEPYFIYERTAKEFDMDEIAVSYEDMATATVRVFFEQRRRTPG